MDKRVIFAVAGSGKTTHIIKKLSLDKRSIIVTYTINNTETLKNKVIKKFGCLPNNIVIYSYYSFLYSFCYKPLVSYKIKVKGIIYDNQIPNKYIKKKRIGHYLSPNKWLYSHRLSKLFIEFEIIDDIKTRLSKYFDNFFIDEVQDFAANDFNFITEIAKANINILFVGDFYQHTFDTSRDGNTNKNLHENYDNYKERFTNMGLLVDETSLIKSRRCTPTICEFISEKIGVRIESEKRNASAISFVSDEQYTDAIIKDNNIIKLFYQKHGKYDCYSENWGKSKGAEYENACIVLNKTTFKKYEEGKLNELATKTKNKFYVACTRTKNNIYFIEEERLEKYKK